MCDNVVHRRISSAGAGIIRRLPACAGRNNVVGVVAADRMQVLAFRLASHHLSRRVGPRSLVRAAAACGIQETPLASAAVALLARVDGLTLATLDRALLTSRTLVSLWSVRGAPYVVPAVDLGVYTRGALPLDAASFRQSLGGWADALDTAGLDPFDTLDDMVAAAKVLLDGETMDVNRLRDDVYVRVPSLSRMLRPSFAHDDMPEPLFRALGIIGAVCIVAGRGTDARLARVDQWLETPPPSFSEGAARAELARRFLHCYGPATARHFAEWTGRSVADAKHAFSLISDEIVEATIDRTDAVLLRGDEKALLSPPEPRGVRLLPVLDPYLQQRDRATLVPDRDRRRALWQPVRGPGGVLADGEIVGTWRARTAGKRLDVTVELFHAVRPATRDEIIAEAARIAPFRRCDTVDVTFVE
jgi:hypothetical protein